ncbi:MAG TPA: polysaccharide deacetylase family protein [Hyphomicrobiaceae bacterium]|nr:polysaccharide deacetylase family protein [Hyphomicrobiaceae bacterium]
MTLPANYFDYPYRRPGMDHDRYPYSNLFKRKPVLWPSGARIALWIVPTLEFFPLDMAPKGVKPPGGLERPFPDYWNYTLRDYGNRVGFARLFRALESRGLKASVAMSSRLAERYPHVLQEVNRLGFELIAHGIDMHHIHATGIAREVEREWIERCLSTLRRLSGQPVKGWYSPAYSESGDTLDLVAAAGCDYVCDWVNDDMPYQLQTKTGSLCAMPHAYEISDLQIFHFYKYKPAQFVEQVMDHFDFLYREAAASGGRIVALSLRPWISGVPHRIAAVEQVLDRLARRAGVWSATGSEILAAWKAQQ